MSTPNRQFISIYLINLFNQYIRFGFPKKVKSDNNTFWTIATKIEIRKLNVIYVFIQYYFVSDGQIITIKTSLEMLGFT